MKSVKNLSEELQVSKQTIFNSIKRLNIKTIKQENSSYIKEDADIEKIIQRVNANKKKYGFESTTSTEKSNESDNTNSKFENYTQLIETLKNKMSILNNKIEKQESCHKMTIEFYRKELQERSKLLKNQQILILESNKKIQKLEYKLEEEEKQLDYTSKFDTSNKQTNNVQKATFNEKDEKIKKQIAKESEFFKDDNKYEKTSNNSVNSLIKNIEKVFLKVFLVF
ncbi:DUF536 domain-containing protein [Staphylococcus sp. MSU001]